MRFYNAIRPSEQYLSVSLRFADPEIFSKIFLLKSVEIDEQLRLSAGRGFDLTPNRLAR
jgi:hypothetical protein